MLTTHPKHKITITQNKSKEIKNQIWSPPMTSDLETERVYARRNSEVRK